MAAPAIPLALPSPDGKPGDSTKPVKVYILAGQSNMVGMGDISGASPPFPNHYLSADPAIIPGATPIGGASAGKPIVWIPVARHGVFDAKASVHPGPPDTRIAPLKSTDVALGTLAETLPAVEGSQTLVVTAQIDVPKTGTYRLRVGYGESSHNFTRLEGREVYRKEPGGEAVLTPVQLTKGKRYPVEITYFKGGSAVMWLEEIDIKGKGDLVTLTKNDGKFQYLIDEAGKWTVRGDVTYTDPRLFPERPASALSATSNNGKSIGPELGFGHVMGTFHDEQVLLIKTSNGNRSLDFDFRPPSSGKTNRSGADQWEGLEYRLMIEGVRDVLKNIDKVVPGYAGQGYEVAGFGWFQGHKDSGSTKEAYEKNLINLINDLRKEFNAPEMKAVVATVGFEGYNLSKGPWKGVWEAQMAVGDAEQNPEFSKMVASVDTRDFWREVEESPRSQGHHYHRNAETFLLVGEAMGRAMVRLSGGQAEPIPKSDREELHAARMAAAAEQASKPSPTDEQKTASMEALKPMVLGCALPAFVRDPRVQPLLDAAWTQQKPAKEPPYLGDALDDVVSFHQATGDRSFDWQPFAEEQKDAAWDYFSFNLPDNHDRKAGGFVPPAGMENWFATDFDVTKAGWSRGEAPFSGTRNDPDAAPTPEWYGGKTNPGKTVSTGDVLLLRRTFDLPPLKEGHRYRVRLAGSARANFGDGFAIYANGKPLAESKAGVTAWRREGSRPRGAHIRGGSIDDFKGGKVTLAVASFPMNNRGANSFIPAGDPLDVWFEEMKLPPKAE